ncbi:MAG: PUR family DNA/RNA-binding protein [Tannerellaceae bacterium]|nr:PUR family DNA/RNA-binding protein [Tannerellaceae bacterium]
MEESMKKTQCEGGDKEILYSKAIKAGKRIYYLDVKKNLKDDLFLAITESKKIQPKDGSPSSFEKHKIFLYKEDFDKFLDGMNDVIGYIRKRNEIDDENMEITEPSNTSAPENKAEISGDEIKLTIEF